MLISELLLKLADNLVRRRIKKKSGNSVRFLLISCLITQSYVRTNVTQLTYMKLRLIPKIPTGFNKTSQDLIVK